MMRGATLENGRGPLLMKKTQNLVALTRFAL